MATNDTKSDWAHGPISGPINASLLSVALVLGYPFMQFPLWLPIAAAAAGVVVTLINWRVKGTRRAAVAYRTACWLAGGGWTTWAITKTWDAKLDGFWIEAGPLVVGALVAGLLAPLFATEKAPEVTIQEPAAPRSEIAIWKERIDRICDIRDPGVDILSLEWWQGRTGLTLVVEFPIGSPHGWERIRDNAISLGRSARLANGCVPIADEGEHQGQAILKVPMVYELAEEITYPHDYSELTVLQEHQIGRFADRKPTMVEVRESSTLVAGRKGGGKTNIMDVYTANFARCDDALIWHIDLNGGGMSVPWFVNYLETGHWPGRPQGHLPNPIIDWVAADEDEAVRMTDVALAILRARKAGIGKQTHRSNSRLAPISHKFPEIIIMIDEVAEVLGDTGHPKLKQNVMAIMRMGRAVGVNMVISTLRPVSDHLPVQVRKNCTARIVTKVDEDVEYDYAFNYNRGLKSSHLKHKGCAFIYRGDEDSERVGVEQFRSFHLLPEQIDEIVEACSARRPQLDPKGTEIGGKTYAQRWLRLNDWLTEIAEMGDEIEDAEANPVRALADLVESGAVKADAGQRATIDKAMAAEQAREDSKPMSTSDALERYRKAKLRAADERVTETVLNAPEEKVKSVFDSLISQLGDDEPATGSTAPATAETTPAPTASLAERAALVARIVTEAGSRGLMRKDIISKLKEMGIEVTDKTVTDWINAAKAKGLVQPGEKLGHWLPGQAA